jgi:hypothetical protein
MPTKNPTKEQRRRWNWATRYGITAKQYADMMNRQNNLCALCQCPMERPVVDHDHLTGKVRGILCHPCNVKLPTVEDSGWVMLAWGYLSDHALTLQESIYSSVERHAKHFPSQGCGDPLKTSGAISL